MTRGGVLEIALARHNHDTRGAFISSLTDSAFSPSIVIRARALESPFDVLIYAILFLCISVLDIL